MIEEIGVACNRNIQISVKRSKWAFLTWISYLIQESTVSDFGSEHWTKEMCSRHVRFGSFEDQKPIQSSKIAKTCFLIQVLYFFEI